MKNPFVFGRVVSDENFCNRQKELKQLKAKIEGGNSVWLYSPRRYGKTSLITKAFREIDHNLITPIYIDLSTCIDAISFVNVYFNKVSKSLVRKHRKLEQIMKRLKNFISGAIPSVSIDQLGKMQFSLSFNPAEKIPTMEEVIALPEKIAVSEKSRIVVCLDEVQEIAKINKDNIIKKIRSIIQFQEHCNYIFTGSSRHLIETIFTNINSPLYQFGEHFIIGKISSGDWRQYIKIKFAQTSMEISDTLIDKILFVSKNHPHFTQLLSAKVWEKMKLGQMDEENSYDILLQEIIQSQITAFQAIISSITIEQLKVLRTLAENGFKSIYSEEIRRKYALGPPSSVATAITSLYKKDLLNKEGNEYSIADPIFAYWLRYRNENN